MENQNQLSKTTTNIRKCLQSEIYTEKKPFYSIFNCKNTKIEGKKDSNVFNMGRFGPLIVTHKENKEKIKPSNKKFKYEEDQVPKFNYFTDHHLCEETLHYWTDLQHPKILRHYSKEKNKNKYKKLTEYWIVK
jgi:hypothetical protein